MIEVFGVRFDSMSELAYSLKYASPLAKKFILNQYGSLERLVTTRLHVTDSEAPAALLKARDAYRLEKSPVQASAALPGTTCAHVASEVPEYAGVKAFFRVLLSEVAEEKKEGLFKLVALSLNKQVDELKQELDNFLKS